MEQVIENLPDILVPHPIEWNCWLRDYTSSGKVEDFSSWDELEAFIREANFLHIYSVLRQGEHKGKTIKQVWAEDKPYIEDCLEGTDSFFLEARLIKAIILEGYEFMESTVYHYKQKLCNREACVNMLVDYHNDLASNDEYSIGGDGVDDWTEGARNPHYNDNLDMDQQSPEYWNSI